MSAHHLVLASHLHDAVVNRALMSFVLLVIGATLFLAGLGIRRPRLFRSASSTTAIAV